MDALPTVIETSFDVNTVTCIGRKVIKGGGGTFYWIIGAIVVRVYQE
jgi:hypothetical protein